MSKKRVYVETFDNGPRGWIGWDKRGGFGVEIGDSSAISRGPWWIDCNHCSPGEGYLHLLFALHTRHFRNVKEQLEKVAGKNPFVEGSFPTDFRNAKITVKIKGDVGLKGSKLLFHAQGEVGNIWVNQVFAACPLK